MLREVASAIELNLLEQCLQYNPLQRISAKEALQHEYFANYGNTQQEGEEVVTSHHHSGEACFINIEILILNNYIVEIMITRCRFSKFAQNNSGSIYLFSKVGGCSSELSDFRNQHI